MAFYLGMDTSNYTTSAALYDSGEDRVYSVRRLLPVGEGEAGLRQSDAVFWHVRQLPQVLEELYAQGDFPSPAAVCASVRPRNAEGSYMPAFLVGRTAALAAARACRAPFFPCSHQEGHVVSALHSAGAMDWLSGDFLAFHVSGGTTECLLARPQKEGFSLERVAGTLDLNAGQLIDRIGVLLGFAFPCGMELDRLSRLAEDFPRPRPAFKGADCHFSGAQNQCETLLKKGAPKETAARFAVEYVCAAVDGMTQRVLAEYGPLPVLYAGGVMSNSLIRERLSEKYGGVFAEPACSSDNASGPAILAEIYHRKA